MIVPITKDWIYFLIYAEYMQKFIKGYLIGFL